MQNMSRIVIFIFKRNDRCLGTFQLSSPRIILCIVFVIVSHFHPFLRFTGQAWTPLFQWSPERGSAWVGTGLAHKYQITLDVTDNGKHSLVMKYLTHVMANTNNDEV